MDGRAHQTLSSSLPCRGPFLFASADLAPGFALGIELSEQKGVCPLGAGAIA